MSSDCYSNRNRLLAHAIPDGKPELPEGLWGLRFKKGADAIAALWAVNQKLGEKRFAKCPRIGSVRTLDMFCNPVILSDEFELGAEIESDTRSLWPAVDALLEEAGPGLRCMRDATRGGVASVLNELARSSNVAMLVREAAVPVHPAVAGAAEILGIDPMYVANEGKLVAFVEPGWLICSQRTVSKLRMVYQVYGVLRWRNYTQREKRG